jgi:hypothetical protein
MTSEGFSLNSAEGKRGKWGKGETRTTEREKELESF